MVIAVQMMFVDVAAIAIVPELSGPGYRRPSGPSQMPRREQHAMRSRRYGRKMRHGLGAFFYFLPKSCDPSIQIAGGNLHEFNETRAGVLARPGINRL